ncbi:hypothetical protein OPS25_11380 [Alteromonas ponticola]|uniref:DUF1700 domain-containing protein n=1 Tax=Alteromonas aquimaris TaxID=2998417 RepID=A0ABT3P8L0_9ALTE|nr:hypothetical protein [Alteromonas aquimaris]MCW8109098.1 hypothetical protein [Alteromonas aquimaris]
MNYDRQINQYLITLAQYMSRLDTQQANEVIREIESHIYDVIDNAEIEGRPIAIDEVLARFGSPRQLAQQYSDHLLMGTPPPPGFTALRKIKKSVTAGVFYGSGIVGYILGAVLIIIGILKVFMPESVGVWVNDHGQSIILGVVEQAPLSSDELLGIWLIPVGIATGSLITYLTYRLLSVLKQYREH